MKHLPQYIKASPDMRAKGVDMVACVSVNDAFVMDAWGKSVGADGHVTMLADGNAKFSQAMGTGLDLSDRNVGIRSQRYAAVIDDLVVRLFFSAQALAALRWKLSLPVGSGLF